MKLSPPALVFLLISVLLWPEPARAISCRSSHIRTTNWRGAMGLLDIRGFRSNGSHIEAAVLESGGRRVRTFYNREVLPQFLRTTRFSTLLTSAREIQREINLQNRPAAGEQSLFWKSFDSRIPVKVRRLMAQRLPTGINCFSISLALNGLVEKLTHISRIQFLEMLQAHFVLARKRDVDLALILEGEKPIHAYLPIGRTGWVITKNGYEDINLVRLMRETDLISYYRTWNPEEPKTIRYFALKDTDSNQTE